MCISFQVFRFYLLPVSLAMIVGSALHAQPRPPRGDPFFDALREVHQENPNKDLFELINHKDIRDEIELSEAESEKISENTRDAIREIFALRQKYRNENKTTEALKEEIRKAVAPFDAASYEVLKQNAKFDRLLGLYVQARNFRAVLNEQVAERIGLSAEELEAFRKVRQERWEQIMKDIRHDVQEELRNMDEKGDPRKAFGRIFDRAERKLDHLLGESLTEEQRTKLAELRGNPFDLPVPLFEMPPGGGRSRRGPPDGGGRSGSGESQVGKDGDDRQPSDRCHY